LDVRKFVAVLAFLSKDFRSALGPMQLPIQMVMNPFPWGKVAIE